MEPLLDVFSNWPVPLLQSLQVAGLFVIAFLVHKSADAITHRVAVVTRLTASQGEHRPERIETARRLIASFISFVAYAVAFIISLSIFVGGANVIWLVGLFGAAFGIAARPIVSDYLTGIKFMLDDPFDVGEKIEFIGSHSVRGVVEEVSVHTTLVRAYTGEIFSVPNGEIRVIRNFSRGSHSEADIVMRIQSADLAEAITLLDNLSAEAPSHLPNLLEPWSVISEDGHLGQGTQLRLLAKARFGRAAQLRPRLHAYIHEHFEQTNIDLTD